MEIKDLYVTQNNKRLRCGYTTGTCATAAAKACAYMLLSRKIVDTVRLRVPKGVDVTVELHDISLTESYARCSVVKDGGDDIDATHGMKIFSRVELTDSGIDIDGGEGIGRVTKNGLDQPVGNAAINSTPRRMITNELQSVASDFGYKGGFSVKVYAPEGEKVAVKTFNPNLGILGGISILGTSGIVEPMSESALIATIVKDMDVRKAEGRKTLLVVPGNYGKDFVEGMPGIDGEQAVKCSNFVGDMLDHACEIGTDIVLVGNLGKLVKLAGGIMNTHSRNADCRMEILAANAALAGGDIELVREVAQCNTTDDALDRIVEAGLKDRVSELLMIAIDKHMKHRTGGAVRTAAVVFSTKYGLLGKTELADEMLEAYRI
jgi:cobalt-precorrin-5B (C1)-methyltransferase